MTNNQILEYRRAAVRSASAAGLVIMLYDTLVGDLRRASGLIEQDPETCASELQHGFLVLQQLEGSLQQIKGDQLASCLVRFYSYLRAKILEAQIKRSPQLLNQLIEWILQVREAWQEQDQKTLNLPTPVAPYMSASAQGASASWSV